MRTLIFLFLFLLISVSSYSKTIEKIEIYGLKWTKEKFVRRELLFKEGDEFAEEKLKKSKELIEEAIKLLNGTPTSNSIREVLDFAKIRIREAINDILNNNIDGEHGAINKLKEALKIINYNIGD